MPVFTTTWIRNLRTAWRPASWKLLLLLAGIFVATAAVLANEIKDPDQRVDEQRTVDSTSSEHRLSIDMDAERAYVGYVRRRYLTGHDAYINISTNQGGTWRTGETRLNTSWSPGSFDGDMQQVLVSSVGDNNVYALMVRRDFVTKDAYIVSSADQGMTWSSPFNATAYAGTDAKYQALAAAPGGKAHIVVQDERDSGGGFLGYWSIWLRSTTDGGQSWGAWQRVNALESALRERAEMPTVCADDSGTVHIAWRDKYDGSSASAMPGDIRYRRFTNNGSTPGAETRLDVSDTPRTPSDTPSLDCSPGGQVFTVWADERSGSSAIYFNINTGSGWAGDALIPGSDVGNATEPVASIAEGSPTRLYVTWKDDRDGGQDLYFSVSTNAGTTWSTPQRVNLGVPEGEYPVDFYDMSSDGTLVGITFADDRNNPSGDPKRDVFTIYSLDGGQTFGAPERMDLGSGPGAADATEVTQDAAAGAYVATWSDFRADPVYPDVWANGWGEEITAGNEDDDLIPTPKDNCPNFPNDNQYDMDGDFRGDPCDSFPRDPWNDLDGDGYPADQDVCPNHADSFQDDTDGDGIGDACDLCPGKVDPPGPQRDLDGDGTADFCDDNIDGDAKKNDVDEDDDNDGVPDLTDNCPTVPNPFQTDHDSDGEGDECDGDDLLVASLLIAKEDAGSVSARWSEEATADSYVAYIGSSLAGPTENGACYHGELAAAFMVMGENPVPGDAYWYLVAASSAGSEGSIGRRSSGALRGKPPGPCDAAAASDWDQDGQFNAIDNCPMVMNESQADSDNDGIGDACEY